eukprot:2595903-Pleurochrysis_carterae.AAC.1
MGVSRFARPTAKHDWPPLSQERLASEEPKSAVDGAKGFDTLAELEPCEKTEYHPASDGADEADGDMDNGESNDEAAEGKAKVVADGFADTVEKTVLATGVLFIIRLVSKEFCNNKDDSNADIANVDAGHV